MSSILFCPLTKLNTVSGMISRFVVFSSQCHVISFIYCEFFILQVEFGQFMMVYHCSAMMLVCQLCCVPIQTSSNNPTQARKKSWQVHFLMNTGLHVSLSFYSFTEHTVSDAN